VYTHAKPKSSLGLYIHLINFGGIYLVAVYHISIDVHTTIKRNKFLLVLSIYVRCSGHVDHPQALKYMTLKSKMKCIYICIYFKFVRYIDILLTPIQMPVFIFHKCCNMFTNQLCYTILCYPLLEIGFGMVDFEIFLKAQNCFTFLTPK
jgi:hypothetical protein